jgi:hypothetical protein
MLSPPRAGDIHKFSLSIWHTAPLVEYIDNIYIVLKVEICRGHHIVNMLTFELESDGVWVEALEVAEFHLQVVHLGGLLYPEVLFPMILFFDLDSHPIVRPSELKFS